MKTIEKIRAFNDYGLNRAVTFYCLCQSTDKGKHTLPKYISI